MLKKNHDSNLVWITNNWSKSTSDVQTLDDNFIYLILAAKTLKNGKKSNFREIQEKKNLRDIYNKKYRLLTWLGYILDIVSIDVCW